MQRFYADLMFVDLPSVLGRKLLPLSLGHSFILDALNLSKHDLTVESVIGITWVCSQPWDIAARSVASGAYKQDVKRWGAECEGKVNLVDYDAINDYIDIYMSHPPEYETADARKPCPIPWQVALVWLMMERMSMQDAWNLPCNQAFAFSATNRYFNSIDGKTNLISEAEEEENKLPPPELSDIQKEILRKHQEEHANGTR